MIKDDIWLEDKLNHIFNNYFSDVKKASPIKIVFSRVSKYRFGSIRQVVKRKLLSSKSHSKILINGMFKSEMVPVEVVEYTIGHELAHYAHGFSSSLTRLHRYPHHGQVVNLELEKRGMAKQIKAYKEWLKVYRKKFISK
jgi:hypothetical protein